MTTTAAAETIVHTFEPGDGSAYDIHQLWSLTSRNPEFDVPFEDIKHELDAPAWSGTGDAPLSPNEVLLAMKSETGADGKDWIQSHIDRIKAVDMKYALLLRPSPDSCRWMVIDGLHRLAAAYLNGQTTVRAKIVSDTHMRMSRCA
jgi:hypothetical protein